ncbi:CaiB/BaiF CoA transferase family protein [Ovoidimarina sediminis]|uniref:CaiB/BaiF CoA transferase family protein n=1 Tax=Ovoidimarina sediminis TaxID=3079856 RepID=UPI0029137AAD|nr:CaiB/BaiF CoA-transferase family protein [Rhodophyticola sp. MJ-SS7]MDU8945774.1 CaiB/BaiF CoA-transferase family protein [Rhodophyticola sp. MJ-SS7]
MPELPLRGTRILEVEGIGPGPFAAMMLGDLGADVIVVHRPRIEPPPGTKELPITDRGKRSITLDLKSSADCAIFMQLVSGADGLIEGFRPGVMERLGLGPKDCHESNTRLVYGRMTGWGQAGPLASRAGHDLNYISLAGALWATALPGERPSAPPTLLGDIGGGALYLVAGMLSGLLMAMRTGQGTVVDAAIYDGVSHLQNLLLSIEGAEGRGVPAQSNPLVGAHWSRTYRCADDRFLSVQCLEPKFYQIFLERLGLSDDRDFSDNQFNRSAWPRLSKRLEDIFLRGDLSHWDQLFAGSDTCVAPVLSPEEAYRHPHNQMRETWQMTSNGLQAAAAPRFLDVSVGSPPSICRRGEHTDEILTELNSDIGWGSSKPGQAT